MRRTRLTPLALRRQCFSPDLEWVKPLSAFGNETVCACNLFFGWQGPSCDDPMPRLYIAIIVNFLMMFVAFFAWLVLSVDAVRLWRIRKLTFNAAGTTMLFTWILAALLVILTGYYSASAFQPQYANKVDANNPTEKYGSQEISTRVVFGLSLLAAVVATLNVSLFWIDVVSKSSKLSSSNRSTLARYGKIVVGLEIAVTCIAVPLLLLSQYFFLTLAMVPFLLFVFFTYAYGAMKMTTLLLNADSMSKAMSSPQISSENASSTRQSKVRRAVVLIRQTAFAVIGNTVFAFVSAVIYSIMTIIGLQAFQNPDLVVGWSSLMNQFVFLGITGVLATIARYVHLSVSRAHLSGGGSTVTSGTGNTGTVDSSRANKHQIAPSGAVIGTAVDTNVDTYVESTVE